jgi:hypothetical protein
MLFHYMSYSQSDIHISLEDYCLDWEKPNLFSTCRKKVKNCIIRMKYDKDHNYWIVLKLYPADI